MDVLVNEKNEKAKKKRFEKTYFEEHAEELLAARGITKAKLAKSVGVAPQNIVKLFGTKNVITLTKVSKILHVPIQVLIDGTGDVSKDIHGCIYLNGKPNLIASKEELKSLIEKF